MDDVRWSALVIQPRPRTSPTPRCRKAAYRRLPVQGQSTLAWQATKHRLTTPGSTCMLLRQERPLLHQEPVTHGNALELAFDSKALRDICERAHLATHVLGADGARLLRHRLADLQAASSPLDLPIAQPRSVDEAPDPTMAMPLSHRHQLVFVSNHIATPLTAGGDVDWALVNRIKILRIEEASG